MEKPESFLDKQTIFALIIIFLAWLGWERYMRTRYPAPPKQPAPAVSVEKSSKLKSKSQPKEARPSEPEEKLFPFENARWKAVFSSRGAGVKSLLLKEFVDKEKKNILFDSEVPKKAFFQLYVDHQPLFFHFESIKKDTIKGWALYKKERIYLNIQVHKYFLAYKILFNPDAVTSFQIKTGVQPKEKPSGFFKSLLTGGRKGLSFFSADFNQTHRVLYSDEDVETLKTDQALVFGIGSRYFGQAFVNNSEITPSLVFEGKPQSWQAQVTYSLPLNTQVSKIQYRTFFGPKLNHELKTMHPELSKWIDFGFFRWLSSPLLECLRLLFSITKNWGVSIIILTLIFRLLLFPLNQFMHKAMKVMKDIQPEMKAIREKYKSDVKKMNTEILALMKKHNAKPFSMYVPLLVQFPVFIALYPVFGESFELYQAPFFGWIQDLSSKDPFYILPLLMGVTMFLHQKISPTNLEPMQEKVFRIIPVIFTILMLNLPSGLTLYIFVSTLFGLVQQYYFVKKS